MDRQLEFQTASGYLRVLNLNSEKLIDKEDLSFTIQNDVSFAINEVDYSQIKSLIRFELIETQTSQSILSLEYEVVFQTDNDQSRLPEGNIFFV